MKIERKKYIEEILGKRNNARIIGILGMKGVGKTTLLEDICVVLKNEHPPLRIVKSELFAEDSFENPILSQSKALGVGPSALLIDDSEKYHNLTGALDSILQNYSVTIFLTMRTLSQEALFMQNFSDAFFSVHLATLSFTEFLQERSLDSNSDSIISYANHGGLPSLLPFSGESLHQYQQTLSDSIILREIIEPNLVRAPLHIRLLLEIVRDHTGESISSRDLCNVFSIKKIAVSPQTILDYLSLCKNALILYSAQVFDITKDVCVEGALVYYFADTGFSHSLEPVNTTRAYKRNAYSDAKIENLLYLALRTQKWTIYKGKIDKKGKRKNEVTFVLEKNGKRIYLQHIGRNESLTQAQRKRETLFLIKDAWPKYTIGDDSCEQNYKGIQHMSVSEVLSNVL